MYKLHKRAAALDQLRSSQELQYSLEKGLLLRKGVRSMEMPRSQALYVFDDSRKVG